MRVFPHPVLSKEECLNTVIFFYFRTESEVGKHFPQGLCLPVYLENVGDAACEWEKTSPFQTEETLKTLLVYEMFCSLSSLHVILCSDMF